MKRAVTLLSLGAGTMDATTGLVLVAAPAAALGIFGLALPGGAGAEILMRWIGAFVAGVGLSYLWAVLPRDDATRAQRLPGVWGATAVVRTGVALFCTIAVAARQLEPVWLVVGATDAALAIVQFHGLRKGWFRV